MAGSFNKGKDSIEISELASLNDDISDDFIDQLHQQITQNIAGSKDTDSVQVNPNDDSTLFEEPAPPAANEPPAEPAQEVKPAPAEPKPQQPDEQNTAKKDAAPANKTETPSTEKKEDVKINTSFDDNFIKKYKAKLNKKTNPGAEENTSTYEKERSAPKQQEKTDSSSATIEQLSDGNISEKAATQEQIDYNSSLDFLDGNVKYSKYVIYIDPENIDFIDSLTVKERKNLINSVLRQQDNIVHAKHKFKLIRTFFVHIVVAVIIFSISIPIVYNIINASLEATIDNYRRSQINWQILYRQHGKIPKN